MERRKKRFVPVREKGPFVFWRARYKKKKENIVVLRKIGVFSESKVLHEKEMCLFSVHELATPRRCLDNT